MNKRFFNQQNLTRRLRMLFVLFAMVIIPNMAWGQWDTKTFTFNGATDDILYAAVNDETIGYSWNFHIDGHYCAALVESKVKISVGDNYGKGVLTPPDGFTIKKVTLNYSNLEVTEGSKIYVRAVDRDTTTHYTGPYLMTSDGTLDIDLTDEGILSDNLCFLIFSDNDKAYSYILNSITITKIADYHLSIGGVSLTGSNVNPETGAVTGLTGVYFTPANNTASPATPATLTLNSAAITGQITSSIDALTVHLVGKNTITPGSGNSPFVYNGSLDNGTLTFESSNSEAGELKMNGITGMGSIASGYTVMNDFDYYDQNGVRWINQVINYDDEHYTNIYYNVYYGISVNGTAVSKCNKDAVKGLSGDDVSYTPSDNTLHIPNNPSVSDYEVQSHLSALNVSIYGDCALKSIRFALNDEFPATSGTLTIMQDEENAGGLNKLTLSDASGVIRGFTSVTIVEPLKLRSPASTEALETASSAVISNYATAYDITVAGVQVTDENATGITGTGITGTVSFTPAGDTTPATLTLEGANLTEGITTSINGLVIDLIGDNTITSSTQAPIKGTGTDQILTLKSSGTTVGSLKLIPTEASNYNITQDATLSLENPLVRCDDGNNVYFEEGYQLIVGGIQMSKHQDIAGKIGGISANNAYNHETNTLTLDGWHNNNASIVSGLPVLNIKLMGSSSFSNIMADTDIEGTKTLVFQTEDSESVLALAEAISGFNNVNYQNNLVLRTIIGVDTGDSYSVETISKPTMAGDGSNVTFTFNDGLELHYSIDYVKEGVADVTDVTIATSGTSVALSGPCTVTAYTKWNNSQSDNVVGKLFGFATESVSGYAGQESIPFSLVPAINVATDGLTLGTQTGNENIVAAVNDAYDTIILGEGLGLTFFRVTMKAGAETPYTILNYIYEGTANIGPLDVKVSVAEPTVSPDATGGPFNIGQLVTLGYEYEPSNDVHSIKYIVGEDLTVAPTTYTAPFALNETAAVNAWVETTYSGNKYSSDTVTVNYAIKQDPKLKVSYTWYSLRFGETFSQEVTSDMPTTPTVTWSSSNTDVATVDPTTGVVTPVAAYGSDIEITATFAGDDTWSAASVSYAIRVGKAEQYLRIKYKGTNIPLSTVKVEKGNPIDIKTEYDFSCPEELVGTLVWYSNDENVVTVTNGVITTVGCGSTWIKVSSAGNSNYESDYCDFNIEVAPPKPTINLAEGTYMSTHAPIAITKADIANTAISYTWGSATTVGATWSNYDPDAGVALQTGTLYARVGYTTNDEGVIYSDTASVAYTVIPDIAECTVSGNDNVTYNGADQTPTITVTPAGGGTALTLGTDYTVSYKKGETAVESMIDAGDYTIVITAKEGSAYGGTKEVDFTINQANLDDVTIALIADQTYTGSQITPTDITVTFNGNAVSEDEYTISYGTNINVGEGTVTLTSENKNFSTTSTKGATFTIVAKTLTADMVISVASVTYTGSAVEPELTIRDGDLNLEKGTDYTVIYSDNVSAGTNTAKATITGKGNYTGSADKMFTINKAQLTVTPDDKTYNVGDNIELTVSYDGFVNGETETVLTTQPTASYGTADITKPGSYEITASGGVAQNYDFVYETGTLTINRVLDVSFASNTWATYCGTENLATPEGLQAYIVTAVGTSAVTTSAIDYIPANTAVLLKDVEGKAASANIVASAYEGETTTFPDNILQGGVAVDVSTITGGTVYVLYKDMFKRATGGTIPANRGYLVVAPSSGNAPELSITIGDDTTGIGTVGCDSVATDNDEWYTLDGQKLQQAPTQKGLYIKNGKKVVINKK